MSAPRELRCPALDSARVPAVVLGGLNVTRALGLAGIPVVVGSSHPHDVTFSSRYCTGALRLPPLEERGAVADALARAGAYLRGVLGRPVPLYYCNDDWQRLVQDFREELSQHYALVLNDGEVAQAVIEKDRFQALAVARGLPIPRTLTWEALEDFHGPVLVKPHTKFAWHTSAVYVRLFRRQGKARMFPNGRSLLAEPAARELRGELLIQEYVSGDDRQIWSFHGFSDESGKLLDWLVGRKIRTYPPLTGLSTFLELARDEEVVAAGRQIASRLPLKGVFKIDLKRDARTGRLRLLEVNARYNLWHYLGAANGVNLPAVAYGYLVHGSRPAAPGRHATTCRWVYLRYDWQAYRLLAARGELGLARWAASLCAGPLVCQLFSWRDPLPFLKQGWRRAASQMPRLRTRLRRWLSTAS